MIDIKVRLFGAFRKFGNGSLIELKVPPGVTVEEFRKHFVLSLEMSRSHSKPSSDNDDQLLGEMTLESVFANEERILGPMDRLEQSCLLAILPPVCGG